VPNLDFILADAFIWQDPITLAERGVIGLPPDRALALVWYRRAAALGAAVATRIASLEAEP
jgi:TPR repeat protein